MANREILALNESTPQIEAAQSGDTYLAPRLVFFDGTLKIKDAAAAVADTAGYGQIWVDNATPDKLMFTDDAGTDFQVATTTRAETFTNKTLTSPVISTIVADLSVTGTVESADATTPILSTATGKTNTGYLSLTGKTSGSLKILPADAMAQIVTIAPAAQTVGACTLTIPDQANVSSNFVFDTLAQTLTNKTLAAPTFTGLVKRSVAAGVTADTGSAQGDGAITTDVVQISTCANAGDAVTLPTAVAGLTITVINNGAEACDVFPAASDNLGAGANTAASLAAAANITYVAIDATNWVAVT